MKKKDIQITIFRTLVLALSLTIGLFSFAQNKLKYGHLPYKNYPRNEYNSQQQNFGIIESQEGTILIANKNTILEFNGSTWEKINIRNIGSPKSLHRTNTGRILVGAEDEFGYLEYRESGEKYYISLSENIDKTLIGKIWDIYGANGEYYFIAEKAVFVYNEKTGIKSLLFPEGYKRDNSSKLNDNLFISIVKSTAGQNEKSISHLLLNTKTKTFEKFLPKIESFQNLKAMKFMMPWKDANHFLAITQSGKAFSINTITNQMHPLALFKAGVEDVMISIKNYNDLLIFSTEKNGVFVFDHLGQLIRQINDQDGLIDNSVNYSYIDSQNNLWCATSNGVSFIELSSPISFYGKSDGITSKLEDIIGLDQNIYLASNDIFNLSLKPNESRKLSQLNFGQPSFNFTKIRIDGEQKIMIVGYDGIYSMGKDKKPKSEIPNLYAWKIIQSKIDTNRIFIGLDGQGIASAYWNGANFDLERIHKNTGDKVRSMIEFNGSIYYGINSVGIVKLDTTKTVEENKLPGIRSSELTGFSLAEFNGKLFVGTSDGLYTLNEDEMKLEPFDHFNLSEKKLYVHRVFNENDKRLWLALFFNSGGDNEAPVFGFLEMDKKGAWKFVSSPFKYFSSDIVQGFVKDEVGNIWLGADGGTYIVNIEQINQLKKPFKININKFWIRSDSTLFHNFNKFEGTINPISYDNNSIKINVSAQSYYGGAKNLFRYRLIGKSDEWSEWTDINWKEYQNLDEGTYTIEVQAKDYYDNESEVISITFTILPPWYRTWWAIVIYILGAILLISIIIRLALQRVKKQNERLEIIVKERTAEIAKQNEVLAEQKDEIEIKNKDILDSIKYAKRIQDSILPPAKRMQDMFTDYFVLFKPKDIVSGDFYWAEKIDNKSLFAAVDCTGHGVPGAMVSVVGNNGLNRSVKEYNHRSPGAILDQLRNIVIEAFNATDNMDVKDGMDIALCSIDYANLKLEFSGANNPCVIIRNGELLETKADKQPIGQFINKTPFTNHLVDLQKGDTIYVYTDGYVDQFGGDKGKKLKSRPFKNLLLEIHKLPMKEQRDKMDLMFEEWRGRFEQIDDVCVFGVRI